MKRVSLQNRQLLTASIILTVFLGLTGVALDKAFQSSAESAERGKLEGELYVLLGAAELNQVGSLVMAKDLAEPRFSQPGSGLVAQIIDADEKTNWQSSSSLGIGLPPFNRLPVDESHFQTLIVNGEEWFSYSYGVAWIDEQDREHRYSFRVLENRQAYDQQLGLFRHTLITWLAAAGLLLLFVQVLVLRWSLSPLRRIEEELHEVETGDREQLTEDYPRELNGLAGSLNLLLVNERRHLQRYRNSLADLTHSLKTPLAVLRGLAESEKAPTETRQLIESEVGRMDNIVEYQLQKAAAAGRISLTKGVAILTLTQRLLESLRKVYSDKSISYSVDIDEEAMFMGEEGDLMEIVGNLLDNASKWCRKKVSIKVERIKVDADTHARHRITIEDDGPGIIEEQVEILLQRGVRGDTQTPGHGIGLAVVREIVSAYGGRLEISRSEMGGAKVEALI
jgi:two-component system sensor histidine kinase PhoQ